MDIVVASGKGGVGKSTLTGSLISLLRDYEIVAVDADAEAPNLHIVFNVKEWKEERELISAKTARITDACIECGMCDNVCIYEAIHIVNRRHRIKQYLCEGCGACKAVCPVDAIEISDAISGWIRTAHTPYGLLVSAELDVGKPNSGKLVTEEKNIAKQWIREGKAKHIIVDAAAGIGCQVIASFSGANKAILIAEPTPSSLSDLIRVHWLTEHFRIEPYLVINKYGINPGFDGIEKFAQEKGLEIIGRIPYDSAVPKSLTAMKPLVEFAPDSSASMEIKKIAEVVEEWL